MPFQLRASYVLEPWQSDAVAAWAASRHRERGSHHGILHVYTGAGKTVLAAAAMAEAARLRPRTKFAIVVPSEALAAQWGQMIPRMTTCAASRVGQVGGGRSDDFDDYDVLVYVIDSACKQVSGKSRLARDAAGHEVFLIVDECHKAGSPKRQNLFDVKTWARLGLSATPSREDGANCDLFGRPLPVDHQPHGRAIGPVCFVRSLAEGIRDGCLPRFELHHHAVQLTEAEQREYDTRVEEQVFKKKQAVVACGGEPRLVDQYASGRIRCSSDLRTAALELRQAYYDRKRFLYAASERIRIASLVLEDAFAQRKPVQSALVFNELIGVSGGEEGEGVEERAGAEALRRALRAAAKEGMFPFAATSIAVEHSKMPQDERLAAVEGLRDGRVKILVSVKALQEGLDIPDVGLGLCVASTSSVRQRIQTMGRILRPARDPKTGRRLDPDKHPVKQLHFFYVRGTPDEDPYRKEVWGDFFTAGENRWWRWDADADEGEEMEPLVPPPSEEEAWARVKSGRFPARWPGPKGGLTLSWTQSGVEVKGSDVPIANREEVEGILRRAGVPTGRVVITPLCGAVLTSKGSDEDGEQKVQVWGRVDVRIVGAEALPVASPPEGRNEPPPAIKPRKKLVAGERGPSVPSLPGRAAPTVEGALNSKGWWYHLVQQACLAWANHDDATFQKIRRELSGRRGRSRFGLALLDSLVKPPPARLSLRPEGPAVTRLRAFETNPKSMGHAEKLAVAAAALRDNRPEVVRSIAKEFVRIGKARRDSNYGLANALSILAGDTRAIAKIERE